MAHASAKSLPTRVHPSNSVDSSRSPNIKWRIPDALSHPFSTSNKSHSSSRRATPNDSRKKSTAIKEEFDMWLLPLHEFVGLSALEPHQVLRRKGKLARWDPSMNCVFFISHQWTSFDHPDHTGVQLRAMQRLFLKFMSGRVADTVPDFKSRLILPNDVKVTTKEWQHNVIDFCCIPQIGKHDDGGGNDSAKNAQNDLVKAVNSIPAYVERCTHFFAVCPTIHHKDLPGAVCDYGSWLGRGWCNLEMWALRLARFGELPAIVVKGGEIAPYMMAPTTVCGRLPGHGELTCCTRGHKIRGVDGVERTIPCDRVKIGVVLATMLEKRQKYHLGHGELGAYRLWRAAAQMVLSRLPVRETLTAPTSAAAFLREYKFDDRAVAVRGEARSSSSSSTKRPGLAPILLAAWSGNAAVARELLERDGNDSVFARTSSIDHRAMIGFDTGMTPMHLAVSGARCKAHELESLVRALLEAKADPNAASASGMTPLMAAVALRNLEGVHALIACAGTTLDLERGFRINNSTVLGWAAYISSIEIVEVLLEAGADRAHLSDTGASKLCDASMNPGANAHMLELLWKGEPAAGCTSPTTLLLNLNHAVVPRTRKWGAIYRFFALRARAGVLKRTPFNLGIAHWLGSTPLHLAAKYGHVAQVRWLLEHGAHESLRARNAMGVTPLEMAAIFGPHPEVEAVLGAVMLDTAGGFASRYLLKRGSLEMKALGNTTSSTNGVAGTGAGVTKESAPPRRASSTRLIAPKEAKSIVLGITSKVSAMVNMRGGNARGVVATAVEAEYDMWLLPLHEFIGLSTLQPHQALRRLGKLARWDPSMKRVFFLSHQWTSFDHPDHTGEQLRAMQHLFLKFMSGRVADTDADFMSRVYLPNDVKVTTKEWQRIVGEGSAFVWIDYCSIPQIGKKHDDDGNNDDAQSDLTKAVNSIPAYIERCTHFFAVCPTIYHKDLLGAVCDYGSWLGRGWCNLEMWALRLARFGEFPVIVVKGGEVAPYMMAPATAVARLPGHGELTCCTRGHKIRGVDGVERTIPCDRDKIGSVLATMLEKRQKYHLGRAELEAYRMWRGAAQGVLSRLPARETLAAPKSLVEFLREYKFEGGGAMEGCGEMRSSTLGRLGLTPMHMAAWSGNTVVARELQGRGDDCVLARTSATDRTFGLDKGMTPLHLAVSGARCKAHELEALVKALLEAKADPNAESASGMTPLMAAAGLFNLEALRALIKCAGAALDLERGTQFNNTSALGLAAYMAPIEIVEVLLEAGADRTQIHDAGGSKLSDAVQNPDANARMLKMLWKGRSEDGDITTTLDINHVRRPRTRKWGITFRAFELGVRSGILPKTEFNLGMAHMRGDTPLHSAARYGHVAQVRWLLEHGAHESLRARNAMGATPLEMAAIFGPHPEVEAALGAAMLDIASVF